MALAGTGTVKYVEEEINFGDATDAGTTVDITLLTLTAGTSIVPLGCSVDVVTIFAGSGLSTATLAVESNPTGTSVEFQVPGGATDIDLMTAGPAPTQNQSTSQCVSQDDVTEIVAQITSSGINLDALTGGKVIVRFWYLESGPF